MNSPANDGVASTSADRPSPSEAAPALTPRLATLEDVPAMLAVLEAAFPRWPAFDLQATAAEHLRWKLSPPEGVPASSVVGLLDGEIVALMIRWGGHARLGGWVYTESSSADVAMLPAHQGRGYASQLAAFSNQLAFADSDLGIVPPSRRPEVPSLFDIRSIATAERIELPLRVWLRTASPSRFVATHLRNGGTRHLASAAGRALRAARHRRPLVPGIELLRLDRFDARTDALWDRAASSLDLAGERRADYMNWRYLEPGAGVATVLAATARGERNHLLGTVVVKRAGDRGHVLDLVVDPAHPEVAAHLLEAGWSVLRAQGARVVSCWLPVGHQYESALHAARFLKSGRGAHVSLKRRREVDGFARLAEPDARIHITLGDFDFV